MKKLQNGCLKLLLSFSALIIMGLIVGIFGYIFYQGSSVWSLQFLLEKPSGIPVGTEGGIFPAIIGSFYLGILSGLAGGILALFGAIYTVFYCKSSIIKQTVDISLSCLVALPSILFGLAGYTILIYHFGLPRSLLTAFITITVLVFPFVFIRIQKNLREQYLSVMTTSLSLGIPRSHCLLRIILPHALSETVATILLGMTYGMGATAPVMFTGVVVNADVPKSILDPFMSLSYHLYILANDGVSIEYAYGTASVLILLILTINILCRLPEYLRESRKNN